MRARAELPSRFSSVSCASTAATPLLLGHRARGGVLRLLLQRIAQRGERPVLLGELGEIGQLRRDGLLVRLHRLVEFGDLPLHLGKLRLGRGEPAVGVAKLTPRLGKLRGDRRGLLLRGIGAAGRRREILLQPLRPRGARARLQRGVGELLRQPVAFRTQRVAVGGRRAPPAPAVRQAAATAIRAQCWPPPARD